MPYKLWIIFIILIKFGYLYVICKALFITMNKCDILAGQTTILYNIWHNKT